MNMELFKRLLVYSKPYWFRIALSGVASIGVGGVDGGLAYMVGPLLTSMFKSGGDMMLFRLLPAIVVGAFAFKGLCRYINEYYIRTAGQLAVQDIRNDVYRSNMFLGLRFFHDNPTGMLMSRIMNDVNLMQEATGTVITGLFRDGFAVVGLLAVIFYRDWKLAIITFLVLPATIYPAKELGKKIKRNSQQSQDKMGRLSSILQETFSGIKVIKAFRLENREIERFEQSNAEFYRLTRKSIKYQTISAPVSEIISSFGIAAVIWIGKNMVIGGHMSAGDLASFVAAMGLIYTPMKRLNSSYNVIQRSLGAAVRVFEIVDQTPDILDPVAPVPLPPPRGEVEFRGISFSYGDDYVLKNINLKASRGEVVALVGPSGGGKTTLVSLVPRFYDPTEGAVLIDGVDIRTVKLDELLSRIALVDQETTLFNETIANNIRYGNSDAPMEKVEAAARAAFAHDFIMEMPDGYDTEIGDRGVRLSGGQRQRICIARAILKDAPILILDEATSALDTESEHMVQQAINNLMANRTTFVIAHRLSTILHADRIVVLEKGTIVESGTHSQLLDEEGTYHKLYTMQFSG